MNYTKIYASIVLRAQIERTERLTLKKQGKYFEDHHIIPRSLGGVDNISNMALLTGREHFICHWLLVKIYKANQFAYAKMLLALWRMRGCNGRYAGRYINARAYEYLRSDYANAIGKITSTYQQGCGNSQYGSKWYTNSYDGTCIKSKEPLAYPWVIGRNLFRGESVKFTSNRKFCELHAERNARQLWNMFHNGNYTSLRDFMRTEHITGTLLSKVFNKYIPLFKIIQQGVNKKFLPNKQLINIFD